MVLMAVSSTRCMDDWEGMVAVLIEKRKSLHAGLGSHLLAELEIFVAIGSRQAIQVPA